MGTSFALKSLDFSSQYICLLSEDFERLQLPMKTAARMKIALAIVATGVLWFSASPQQAYSPSIRVIELNGDECDVFEDNGFIAMVFLFAKIDCPISNRCAPEVNQLYEEFAEDRVAFFLVYVDPSDTAESIKEHINNYRYQFPALRDIEHQLVEYCGATVTPEAAVFLPDHQLVYLGRIDNRYADFGVARPKATVRDLHEVLTAITAGETMSETRTPGVGCPIQDLR